MGHGVGSGILSVPYLAFHNRLREILLILLFCYLFNVVLHLIIAELFSGKPKQILTWTAFVNLGMSVIFNVSVFLTGAAVVFRSWLGLPNAVSMLIFYVIGAGVVFIGMKLVGMCEKIAFVIHGYRSDHLDTGGLYYDYYKSRGIDFFCCDHTAHGGSEGQFIGFDVLELRDCLQWIEFLKEKFGQDIEIILHGFSIGGGTVLQMSGHCPEQVKCIITDSAYRNARASLDHQIGPMYQPMRWINRVVAGYDLDDSDVTKSMEQSRIPILFVHGQDDKLVPFENGPSLYERYEGEKDCFFPTGTRHVESMYTSPREYAEKIDGFVKRHLSQPQ